MLQCFAALILSKLKSVSCFMLILASQDIGLWGNWISAWNGFFTSRFFLTWVQPNHSFVYETGLKKTFFYFKQNKRFFFVLNNVFFCFKWFFLEIGINSQKWHLHPNVSLSSRHYNCTWVDTIKLYERTWLTADRECCRDGDGHEINVQNLRVTLSKCDFLLRRRSKNMNCKRLRWVSSGSSYSPIPHSSNPT